MTGIDSREARPEFATAHRSLVSTDTGSVEPAASPRLPEQVARIWERLELRDRSMIVCLEAIVRSVRIDGTATVSDVVRRYVDAQPSSERVTDAGEREASNFETPDDLRRELLEIVLPRLASAEVVSLPASGLGSPDAVIQIANPWLRLALLESGLIQLEPNALEAARGATKATLSGRNSSAMVSRNTEDWSQLWFAIQRYSWRTLVVVPAAPGERGLETASAIVDAGRLYAENSVHLVDATDAAPHAVDLIIASLSGTIAPGTQLVVAIDNPITNPASIPIARHADVALLAVRLGAPLLADARRTIDSIGRQCFIGSVSLRSVESK
ncbi:MAG: hypothetical protein U5K74_01540 [Gemmatimonadaceae bacterium]|nr:hypothetical protein [Gemmatimonadaceae bacterium]